MKKLIVRTILVVTTMVFLLVGCGKAEAEPDVMQEEVKEPETQKEVAELQEEGQKEEEHEVQEEVAENEKATAEMKEAQVAITISDITGVANYIVQLDKKLPHVIIYNVEDGYLIDIKDGEHYQLKNNDKVYEVVSSDEVDGVWTTIPRVAEEGMPYGVEIIPDYTKFESPQECIYGIYLKEDPDTPIYFTYYLDAPVE